MGLLCSEQSYIRNREIKVPEEFFPRKEVSLCICYIYNFVQTCLTMDNTFWSLSLSTNQVMFVTSLYIYPHEVMYLLTHLKMYEQDKVSNDLQHMMY